MIANVWGYCLGSPFYDGDLPEGLMHPSRIRDGVHQGVIDGGNQSGIPWARGFERFDERYIGKPLVYCGTIGRIPRLLQERPSERKEVLPGDIIVMCGGRIGKDGIHGATFSSEELRKESPAQAVQIGDPITQRNMYEFLIEARNQGLYRTLTDNGAGGLSSSVGEMSTLSGGADLDLSKAPLKYEGLQPWEIFLSEAQERMSLAVPPDKLDQLLALAKRREVETTALGAFTDSGALIVRYGDRLVARLELDFLHNGCPRMILEARWQAPRIDSPKQPRRGSRNRHLADLLRSLNVCSKEFKSRQYDGEVKGLSVVKPFVGVNSDVPSDATVLLVEHGRRQGIVLAEGINPFYSDLDTYSMMASVVDEAVRRVFAEFKQAVMANDGPAAAALVSKATVDWYGKTQDLALHANKDEVQGLGPLEKIQVLASRQRVPLNELRTMSPAQLVAYSVSHGWMGKKATERSAYQQAAVCFEQALAALGHIPAGREQLEQAIDLHLDAFGALVPAGALAKVSNHLHEAEALTARLGDERRLGLVLVALGNHAWVSGDSDRALEVCQHALAIATRLGDVPLRMRASTFLGLRQQTAGAYREGVEFLRRAAEALQLHERFGGVFGGAGLLSGPAREAAQLEAGGIR